MRTDGRRCLQRGWGGEKEDVKKEMVKAKRVGRLLHSYQRWLRAVGFLTLTWWPELRAGEGNQAHLLVLTPEDTAAGCFQQVRREWASGYRGQPVLGEGRKEREEQWGGRLWSPSASHSLPRA